MNSQQPDNSCISPRQVMEGIAQIDWICHTSKMLHAQHHAIQLFGFLNPLRNTEICIVTENELEWLFSETETALLNSPAFAAAQVSMLIFCYNCQANLAVIAVCEEYDIAIVQTNSSSNIMLDHLHSHLPRILALRGM